MISLADLTRKSVQPNDLQQIVSSINGVVSC